MCWVPTRKCGSDKRQFPRYLDIIINLVIQLTDNGIAQGNLGLTHTPPIDVSTKQHGPTEHSSRQHEQSKRQNEQSNLTLVETRTKRNVLDIVKGWKQDVGFAPVEDRWYYRAIPIDNPTECDCPAFCTCEVSSLISQDG